MKSLIASLTLLLLSCSFIHAETFGNPPRNPEVDVLHEKIKASYKKNGIAQTLTLLDKQALPFLKTKGATASFDLLITLIDESKAGTLREDQEWNIALTEWCYRYCRDVGNDYLFQTTTPILHNLYFNAGRYAEARRLIEENRTCLMENEDEVDIEKLPARKILDSKFPIIQQRALGTISFLPTKQIPHFIARTQQDLVEGKWLQAMEGAALGCKFSMGNFDWHKNQPMLTDTQIAMTSFTGHWRRLRYVMVQGYQFLDLPEMELAECSAIAAFNPDEQRGISKVQLARARSLQLQVLLGMKDTSVIAEMESIREAHIAPPEPRWNDADTVHLMIADVNIHKGDKNAGWKVINDLRSKTDLSPDMRYQIDMEWCRHRVNSEQYDEVEDTLIRLLRIAREGGLKQREINLYETYAKLLIGLGRYDDALVIQNELLRLLRSFNLFPRLPAAQYQLARIHALMAHENQAKAAWQLAKGDLEAMKIPSDSKDRIGKMINVALPAASDRYKNNITSTDLQPRRALSVPLDGLPARGIFTLTNHSGGDVTGSLTMKGQGLVLSEQTGTWQVAVEEDAGAETLTRDITIPAGTMQLIDLSRKPGAGQKQSSIQLEWKSTEEAVQRAEWHADAAETDVSIAITDAADYVDNPFYLIPVYHLLQYKDDFAQCADMRVIASEPTRIELYNQKDELVFVDTDGDGQLTSAGDFINQDFNRNGMGDMPLLPNTQEARFRLLVRPVKITPGKELQLDLQLYSGGAWHSHSQDKILFAK